MVHMTVEVAYAQPDQQTVLAVTVPLGASVEQAIEVSGIISRFPEIDLGCNAVGIFGQIVPLNQALRAGDRIEIYRPLIIDPKELRRLRAPPRRPRKF